MATDATDLDEMLRRRQVLQQMAASTPQNMPQPISAAPLGGSPQTTAGGGSAGILGAIPGVGPALTSLQRETANPTATAMNRTTGGATGGQGVGAILSDALNRVTGGTLGQPAVMGAKAPPIPSTPLPDATPPLPGSPAMQAQQLQDIGFTPRPVGTPPINPNVPTTGQYRPNNIFMP